MTYSVGASAPAAYHGGMSRRASVARLLAGPALAALHAWVLGIGLLSAAPATVAQTNAADRAAVLAAHRRLIVLTSPVGSTAVDPAADEAESRAGLVLAHEALARRQALSDRLVASLRGSDTGVPADVAGFLDWVEQDPSLRDGDKLAFTEVLGDLRAVLDRDRGGDTARLALRERLDADLRTLAGIRARYDRELGEIRARLATRGMVTRREAWDAYVAHLRTLHDRDAILRMLAPRASFHDADRSGATASKGPRANEINGVGLPPKTLVLTFDDGPHGRFTDRILAILAKYDAPAIFFHVGRNLGTVNADGTPALNRGADVARRVVAAGHVIANHSYSHAHLPSIPPATTAKEIDDTQTLLRAASPDAAPMFRAPYGARNASVLAELGLRQLQSVMWNIDSRDWADPVPASIAQRVVDEVTRQGRGIVLFHDIHERTVEALPLVLEALAKDGYRFAGWERGTFVVKSGARGDREVVRTEPASDRIYRTSHAVVIGIDDYARWPKLRHAVADARGMGELLVRRYGFRQENVHVLLNGEATRENIMALVGGKLADERLVSREDRVLFFFAGHGATRRLANGRDLGYIVPVDAAADRFQGQAISMSELQDLVDGIPAKHVLFLMDSCYSGLALTRGGGASERSASYVRELGRRSARQMLTAGGADEQVADGGPGGHSIFTWTLLQGLEGKADANGDGYITATELAAHVAPVVSSLSRQTPAFGSMPGSEGGDFVFELASGSEFLSAQSRQLDDEAVRLNAAIEKLRADIVAKEARNRRLREELARAEAIARGEKPPAEADTAPPSATALNEAGTTLFKERRYAEALPKFEAALAADPAYALAANNLGFTHYRLENHAESVRWFERTIAIDPNRAVAWLNLGDALAKLGRANDARTAYERYLAIDPNGRASKHVREQLQTIARQ